MSENVRTHPPADVVYEVTVGGQTPDELLESLARKGHRLEDTAVEMIRLTRFTTLKEKMKLLIRRTTVRELACNILNLEGDTFTVGRIVKAAVKRDVLCPPEVAPALLDYFSQQVAKDHCIVLTQFFENEYGRPSLFRCDGEGKPTGKAILHMHGFALESVVLPQNTEIFYLSSSL